MARLDRCSASDVAETGFRSMGLGTSIAHHGELFQGQIRGEDGQLRYCLLSLPCSQLGSKATFIPDTTGICRVHPDYKEKVKRVVQFTLAHFRHDHLGGLIKMESNIAEGKGYGSSTADCVAGAIAAAAAIDHELSEATLAELVVRAEIASDSIMFKHAVLFAHREGSLIEDYLRPAPKIEVLGFDTNVAGRVDTLQYAPAVYGARHIQAFHQLRKMLAEAIRTQDVRLLAHVATASAAINEQFLPKPMFQEVCTLVKRIGGLGVAAAHSGTILSILLDPQDPALEKRIDILHRELSSLGLSQLMRFHT